MNLQNEAPTVAPALEEADLLTADQAAVALNIEREDVNRLMEKGILHARWTHWTGVCFYAEEEVTAIRPIVQRLLRD